MNIQIKLAKKSEAGECLDCVRDSLLWDAYFEEDSSLEMTTELIEKKQIYIAQNENGQIVGFMGIMPEGCFRKFPYLAILSISADYRNRGIGKILLDYYEEIGFEMENRLFVLCSDFNERGQAFYKNNGYVECGKIEDLYKEGIAEHLFVKYKEG